MDSGDGCKKIACSRPVMGSAPGALTTIDGRRYLYFGGTNYLGLAGDPAVIEAGCQALRDFGVHSATTRAGFGHNPVTIAVERGSSAYFGCEDSFYFSSGYLGSAIILAALKEHVDTFYYDASSHYSVIDAIQASGKPCWKFGHRDTIDLERQLRAHYEPGDRPLVATDGVFASTGAIAPLNEYLVLLESYAPAALLVDDAHGFGILGTNGRGSLEYLGLSTVKVNALGNCFPATQGVSVLAVGTLAKAFGGYGGILPGSREFVALAKRSTHLFDGASAPPSAAAGSTAKAIEIVISQPELRARLAENVVRCRDGLRQMGIAIDDWPTPIVSIQLGTAAEMRALHERLREKGILVPYTASYAGIGAEGHLRCALCASHTSAMIDEFLAVFKSVL